MSRQRISLNDREKKFVEGVVQGKSKALSAREAGFSPSTSSKKSHTFIQRLLIRTALVAALAREGATISRIVRPIAESLEAKLVTATKAGPVQTNYPDYRIRLEGAQLAIRLCGGIPRSNELPQTPPAQLVVNISRIPEGNAVEKEGDVVESDKHLQVNISLQGDHEPSKK